MSTPDDRDYFDGAGYDRETVRFFDVAHEGAQIRAVAGALPELIRLRGASIRSVIILAPDHLPRVAAQFAVAERSPLRVPVVVTDTLPAYVGALDVVTALSDRGDDPRLARDLITADRRGAATVLAGPSRGPLLEDTPDDTVVIPALPTVAGFSPSRAIATVLAVLDVLEEGDVPISDKLAGLADNVDAELSVLSPERDESVNPGRQLRSFVEGARVLHTGAPASGDGDGDVGVHVAELAAHLWNAAGLTSGFADPADFPAALGDEPESVADSIFHDPFLDGPEGTVALKTIVWAAAASSLPRSFPVRVDTAAPTLGRLDVALRLIVRAQATPAYTVG